MDTHRVELTTTSILKIFGVILGLYILWKIANIIVLFFVVLILVAALGPAVDWLTERDLPRPIAVGVIYLGIFLGLGFVVSLILPLLVEQLHALTVAFPSIVVRLTPLYDVVVRSNAQEILQSLSAELGRFTQGVLSATVQFFGGAAAALTIFVLSFYLLLDAKQARSALIPLLPAQKVKVILSIVGKAGSALGSWLRGQLYLSLILGLVTYIGLLLLGVPFALTLAVLTFLLEIIPYVGPIIAGFITVLVAYASGSWQLAVATLIFYTLLQQAESHFLVPKIMQSAVGLSPVTVILALAIGAELGGVTGAIIAVPFTAVLMVLAREWPHLRRA